jgi:hypothetical protein
LRHAELLEDAPCTLACVDHAALAVERTDDHVVQHRQAGERLYDLKSAPDAGGANLLRLEPTDALAAKTDFTLIRRVDASDQVEDRRLARAIRADHRDDRLLFDIEARA